MAGWLVKRGKALSQNDVTRVRINRQSIGIIGLKDLMEEMAEGFGKALLRGFKKFSGRPYEEEISEGLEIKVLGPGCVQCNRLEKEIMEIMAEINLAADVEHVTDINQIARYGVMGTPALIVNGKVKSVGSVPSKNKIIGWLEEVII